MRAIILAGLLAALPALAGEEKSGVDQANDSLHKGQQKTKSTAKSAEDQTNASLRKARKSVKSGAKQAEDNTNAALHEFRKKIGTEK
jgi:hypothetical protein